MGAKIKQKIQCAFVSAFSKTSVKVEEIKVVGEDKNWDENEDEDEDEFEDDSRKIGVDWLFARCYSDA